MNRVVEKLFKLKEDTIVLYNKNIVKGDSPFIGVRIPILRKITKDIIKNNQEEIFFKEYNGKYFEEKLIKGIIIAQNEDNFNKYVEDYLKELDSWCLVDTFCSSCKFVGKSKEKYWEFIKKLLTSEKEFIERCGYVFILNYYLCDEYIDEVIKLLLKKSEFYYVNMAVAWCLCEFYINYPNVVEEILNKKILSEFVQNKTIDKINDSLRVSLKDKVSLRKLKYF